MSVWEIKKHLTPPMIQRVILDNDERVYIGDPVKKLASGHAEQAAAAGSIFGHVLDIVDKNNNSMFGSTPSYTGAVTISGSPSSGYVTVATDNETVDKIAALVDVSPFTIYSAPITGTMNTTDTSSAGGGWVDIAVSTYVITIDETTHTRTITNGGQYYNWGVDPDDSTRMLVSISESEPFGPNKAKA